MKDYYRNLTLGTRTINDSSDAYVIAEIGNNHLGDLKICEEMFRVAADAGVDAVKLQKRDNRSLFTKSLFESPYENRNSFGSSYGTHREFLEFSKVEYEILVKLANQLNIDFFATAFDFASADFLETLEMPIYKIASGDLKNIPLIKYIATFNKPIIVSTGGAKIEDVQRVYDEIMPINQNLALLQCTAAYPARTEDLNLRVIESYRELFPDTVIGYSGHDNGIAMPIVAYMVGARVIEKHFTLDRTMKGTDQVFSLAPHAMKHMVRDLRRAKNALGDPVKRCLEVEEAPLIKMGKKLVAAKALPKGHLLNADDIAIKSPGDGLAPHQINDVIGRTLKTSLDPDDDIELIDLNP
jgi:sialic acid synthase